MSQAHDAAAQLSPLKQAYQALDRLQARLDAVESTRHEPIAIVGIGCRLPGGAGDPDAYWNLLREGVDAVAEVPADRWDIEALYDPDPDAPGKMASRWGAWIDGVDRFDARLFGIAPREAAGMDPQQRLILELAWQALESAGQAPDRLSGSRTGVFVGIVTGDYAQLQARGGSAGHIDPYFGSGNAHSMASGRVSYVLGLQGPSMSIDTACSSSLVAVHLAVQSLRRGECDLALAGGVNLMLAPETTIALSKLRMLAPDGRCKAFDARADGFVRGEGAALVVLKRLSDAAAARDPIVALIRGTAVNQDGPSSGLTVPNGPAQTAVIRAALRDGGVAPADVTFVETHGTGTALGDPLEVQALAAALDVDRPPDRLIHIGSVKTNLGHLEAAAGIAGLVKAALSVARGELPPHLHLTAPNPHVPWARLPVTIPTTLTPWPAGAPRIAGVSAFGFSGTNAHVVLEAPPPAGPSAAPRPHRVLCLSAATEAAVGALAERYAGRLSADPSTPLDDVCFTANAGRAHLGHRAAVVFATADAAVAALRSIAAGRTPEGATRGAVDGGDPPRIAFLFTGQGAQHVDMARQLFETEPTFRRAIERCDAGLRSEIDRPLLEVLYPERARGTSDGAAGDGRPAIDDTTYTQPALFAIAYGLVVLWRACGIVPDAVLGHSLGELAAACAAGAIDVEDGLRLAAARGRLMGGLPRDGDMVAVRADEARVRALIAPFAADVAIAAVNGPAESVISGRTATVDAACRDLERQGIAVQRLNVSHAFHSPLMDPILGGIEGVASEVAWKPPAISLISLVTGTAVGLAEIGSGAYWRNQARAPVRFADGMAALSGAGIDAFVEIGPHPVLLGMGRRCLPNAQALWLPSLRRDRDGWQTFQAALGALWVRGAPVVWEGLDRGALRRRVALPTYPFQRTRHWFDHGRATVAAQADARPAITANGRGSRAADRPAGHPLLGTRLASPLAERQFVSRLDAAALPYIADHRVNGRPILPAAAFVELVLAAAEQVDPGARWAVEDLVIHAPLAFEGPTGARPAAEAACQVQTIVVDAGGATRTVRVFARRVDVGSDEGWTLHATARAVAGPSDGQDPAAASAFAPLDDIRSRCREGVTAATHRAQLRSRGLDFGPSLHGVVDIRRRDGEALGQVRLTEAVAGEADRYRIHPAWLDACLQVVAAALPREPHDAAPYFPLAVDRVRVLRAPEAEVLCHVRLRAPDAAPRRGLQEGPATSVGGAPIEDIVPAPASLTSDVTILDARGSPIATITGLQLVRSSRAPRAGAMPEAIPDWLYTIAWRLAPPAAAEVAAAASPTSVDPIDLAGRLAPRLSTLAAEHGLDAHRDLVEHLGTVVAVYVRRAFARLGWVPRPDEATTADRLVERLGIQPRYRRLVERLLAGLAADERECAAGARREPDGGGGGFDARDGRDGTAAPVNGIAGDGQAVGGAIRTPDVDPDTALATLRAAYPASSPLIDVTARCGARLAEVLTGTEDPLALLFPAGTVEGTARLYTDTPEARVFQTLVAEAIALVVAAAVHRRPAGTPLRIIEIGAGTGGTTRYVLDRLDVDRVRYTFTDISAHLVDQGRSAFGAYPFVDFRTLDIERPPGAQGVAVGGYDVVLAANVLHATADLSRAVTHARDLLAPGGSLVLLEATAPERWIDITFGLTDGWWRYADTDRRRAGPLIDADAWRALLTASGFDGAAALVDPSGASRQALVIAQAPRAAVGGTWVIFADAGGIGRRLADGLAAHGATARLVEAGSGANVGGEDPWRADPTRPADLAAAVRAAAGDAREIHGVVYLWGLDMPVPAEDAPSTLEPAMRAGVGGALHLVQALAAADLDRAPMLWLATRGAWTAWAVDGANRDDAGRRDGAAEIADAVERGHGASGFNQAPLWGLGRVIGLEHPELGCVRVDLDPAAAIDAQAEMLLAEILMAATGMTGFRGTDGEDGVAHRHGIRYQARLARLDPAGTAAVASATPAAPRGGPPLVRLVADGGGVLDGIRWTPAERRAPGPGEVEIRVRAAGLNFRDVLNALAMRRDPDPLGTECAGHVAAVGAGVDGFRVGDRVVAIALGSLGTYAVAPAEDVAHLPAEVDLGAGATLPMAFLTADLALRQVARLARGETVLIHAAAGGVGQAAVQIAQRIGAEIIATAGSPEKRSYLASIGIRHVLDSRSLGFADEALRLTGGRGVDVVLNHLAGDFIPASLRALADDGRFVEIGKRDIWDAAQVAAVKPRARYHVVDLAARMAVDPAQVRAMFHALVADVRAGTLAPLPRRCFPFAAAPDAFRFMAQARHIGKVVLVDEADATPAGDGSPAKGGFRADGCYLVTGGLGGLGLAVAEWMAARGAGHLVLVGRRPPPASAQARIAAIEAGGARVVVATGDVADAGRLSEILAAIDAGPAPLRGVIHAAGVLDDGVIGRLDWTRFAAVLAPKVDGAWHLHVLTRRHDLDVFVLFASAAGVFGSAGQANHAAANAFLDALAHHRRGRGLPATSIDWGAWSEIGAAADRGVDASIHTRGFGVIAPARGLEALGEVLRRDPAQVLVSPVDWARVRDGLEGGQLPSWLSEVAGEVGSRAAGAGTDGRSPSGPAAASAGAAAAAPAAAPQAAVDIREKLAEAPPTLRHTLLLDFVTGHAVRVLGLAADEAVDPRRPLHDLGLDSLMAVELRNRLATGLALAQPLPATVVLDHPTLEALAVRLARELPAASNPTAATPTVMPQAGNGPDRGAPPGTAAAATDDLVAAIAALPDDEVDRRLGLGRSE